jgi:hypothetical protein
LTDIGKGVYSAMITPDDAERIFTTGFMRFIDHAVGNIRFKLEFPESIDHLSSAGEEISSNAEDVQTINFSYNDSQFFLEKFKAKTLLEGDEIFVLEISYDDENGDPSVIRIEKTADGLLNSGEDQIMTASVIVALAELITGRIECSEIIESGLYTYSNQNELFSTYKDLIDSYCNLL